MYFITVSDGERKEIECTEKNPASLQTVMGCLNSNLSQTKASAGLSQALASHVYMS